MVYGKGELKGERTVGSIGGCGEREKGLDAKGYGKKEGLVKKVGGFQGMRRNAGVREMMGSWVVGDGREEEEKVARRKDRDRPELYHLGPSKFNASAHQECPTGWTSPPHPFIKLNIDGSFLRNPGIVVFGDVSEIILGTGFNRSIDFASNNLAEACAFRDGLQSVIYYSYTYFLVESSSQTIIQLVNNTSPDITFFLPIIRDW
ncbi:hypothetical protein ACH5RR_034047 [Cinchona calisaya]|uniref:RNase H type-1 domain-containing protein n=1 Tax=Cinchona calisaya TaxID=153742 RepID=A0ABD2YBY0_9GENT